MASDATTPPTVSIVMATYNRSNILGYTIQTVVQGHFQNWELIVVGDACTDDTADAVAGFADPRIRFINLSRNHGEQSGPNNAGVEVATGDYLAFLNHDDLWLPDHLERSIRRLRETNADLVFGQGLVVVQQGTHELTGAVCGTTSAYGPWMTVPASLWVMRRDLAQRIGTWRPARDLRVMPSQDWLYRAHRAQARLIADPVLSAIIIRSGGRKNTYRDRLEAEHRHWAVMAQDPRHLLDILAGMYGQTQHDLKFAPGRNLTQAIKSTAHRLLLAFGIWPPFPKYWFQYYRKGSFLRELRRRRGLPPALPPTH